MTIEYTVLLGYFVVLGIDILRVVRCARAVHLDKKDVTWLTMCFSGALVGFLFIPAVMIRYKVENDASYFTIAAAILIWVTFTTVIMGLLRMKGEQQK